jgi:hypothetical protein
MINMILFVGLAISWNYLPIEGTMKSVDPSIIATNTECQKVYWLQKNDKIHYYSFDNNQWEYMQIKDYEQYSLSEIKVVPLDPPLIMLNSVSKLDSKISVLHFSSDCGESWTRTDCGTKVVDIDVDYSYPSRIWGKVQVNVSYQNAYSDDLGKTWNLIDLPPNGIASPKYFIRPCYMYYYGTIYFSFGIGHHLAKYDFPTGKWQIINLPSPNTIMFNSFIVNPKSEGQIMMVGEDNGIYDIYYTNDNGATWFKYNINSSNLFWLMYDPINDNIIVYNIEPYKLYTTSFGLSEINQINFSEPVNPYFCNIIYMYPHPYIPKSCIAFTGSLIFKYPIEIKLDENTNLYSCNKISQGLKEITIFKSYCINNTLEKRIVSPNDAWIESEDNWNSYYLIGGDSADLYQFNYNNNKLFKIEGSITDYHFFISSDFGTTWQNKSIPYTLQTGEYFKNAYLSPINEGLILVETNTGNSEYYSLFRSTNYGDSWLKVNSISMMDHDVEFSKSDPDEIYIIYPQQRYVLESADGGENWLNSYLINNLPQEKLGQVALSNNGYWAYVWHRDEERNEINSLYFSNDKGATWNKIMSLPDTISIWDIKTDPEDFNSVYFQAQNSIYNTRDNGNTWRVIEIPSDLNANWSYLVTRDPKNKLITCFNYVGIYSMDKYTLGINNQNEEELKVSVKYFAGNLLFKCNRTAQINLYAINGSLVQRFTDVQTQISWHGTDNNGNQLPSGIYFARAEDEQGNVATTKVVLVR